MSDTFNREAREALLSEAVQMVVTRARLGGRKWAANIAEGILLMIEAEIEKVK